jgi:hypothetical protein
MLVHRIAGHIANIAYKRITALFCVGAYHRQGAAISAAGKLKKIRAVRLASNNLPRVDDKASITHVIEDIAVVAENIC